MQYINNLREIGLLTESYFLDTPNIVNIGCNAKAEKLYEVLGELAGYSKEEIKLYGQKYFDSESKCLNKKENLNYYQKENNNNNNKLLLLLKEESMTYKQVV